MTDEKSTASCLSIYWPAVISFFCLVLYWTSMYQFRKGTIPGGEYILAVISYMVTIPGGLIYFITVIILSRRRDLINYNSHIKSSLITMICGLIIFLSILSGGFVTV